MKDQFSNLFELESTLFCFFFSLFSKQINAGAVVLTDCTYWFVIFPFLTIKDYNFSFVSTVVSRKMFGFIMLFAWMQVDPKCKTLRNCCIFLC